MKTAYFAGGCFWCIGYQFEEVDGVSNVVSGFSGGKEVDPTYEDVKAQKTGHRETIEIVYDERKTSFEALLEIFLRNVDLYDEFGQFIDRGHSYTLAVYYNNEEEKQITQRLLDREALFSGKTPKVSIEPFEAFYEAEEYHQNYGIKNPEELEKELIISGRKK